MSSSSQLSSKHSFTQTIRNTTGVQGWAYGMNDPGARKRNYLVRAHPNQASSNLVQHALSSTVI